MPVGAIESAPEGQSPRLIVARSISDAKAAIGMLNAAYPLLVVIRTSETDRRRLIDLFAGWSLGADGDSEWIGPNTLLLTPPGVAPVHIGRTGLATAVEQAFASEGEHPLPRSEEERLLPLAVSGSVSARRRLIDAYAALATMYAVRIRPKAMSESTAVRLAQEELERLVTFPSAGPLLANLFDGIAKLILA